MSKSLGRSSLIFAFMTLISRILGLLRDILIARYFDSSVTDPFFAALRIPNTLRRFFAEGSFSQAFTPVFSATKAQEPEALPDLMRAVSGTLMLILAVITTLGVLNSAWILQLVARGLVDKESQFLLGQQMLSIMFPYIFLISLTALCGAVLNVHGEFAIPAFTPTLLNISLIVACLVANHFSLNPSGIELAWAVLIGGVAQLLLQIPYLKRFGLLVKPRWAWRDSKVKKIVNLMIPTLFGSSVGQLTVLLNTFLASSLITGSISWLYYADRMLELPVALIGVALGTVILPKLSALKSQDDDKNYFYTIDWALRWALLFGSASASMLYVLSPAIIATLFFHGKFNELDVQMSASALQIYALGAFFLIIIKVLTPAFYARYDSKTPVKAGLIAMAFNIIFALILSKYFAHLGLAAATTISSAINMFLLFYFLSAYGFGIKKEFTFLLLRLLLANLAMIAVLSYLAQDLNFWLSASPLTRLRNLILIAACGIFSYLISLYAMGLRWQNLKY